MGARFFGERDIRARVAHPYEIALVALREAFERELADRDEHAESRLAVDLRLPHQAVLDESAEHVENVAGAELLGRAADLLDLREHPAAREDRQPREELALCGVQQIPAPGDRAAKGALSLRQITSGRGEHVEALAELRQHRLRREHLDARRRELDRERQPVEPVTDLGDGARVLGRHAEVRADPFRAVDEEPHRVGLCEHIERGQVPQVGELERRDRKLLLAGNA